MKFFFNILFFGLFCFPPVCLWGQIRTVQCYPSGNPSAEPVIALGSGRQIYFGFDDLSADVNTYTYKIQHCDPDWNSSGLSPFTYLTGFFSNPLDNYRYSFNTDVPYTRFTLMLPNDDVGIKLSGNYLLQVFNDANPDSAVISQRFSVTENRVLISASAVTCTNPSFLYSSQQVNFTVDYSSLPIYNPVRDVRAYVTQNQDPNSRRSFRPVFVRQNQLVYGDGTDNVFPGLSPFRNFQSASLVYYTQYVKDVVKGPEGLYNFVLQPGSVPREYSSLPDRDGNFYIQAENTQNPELEADYIMAHFALLYPQPLAGADVYVYGKFAGWELKPELKMSYDSKHGAYVGEVELKQGYYDYMYAVVPSGGGKPDLVKMQNNFYQTPNEYEIRFYFYDSNLMCFRLVGYQMVKAVLV